jgi:hypothetical protein
MESKEAENTSGRKQLKKTDFVWAVISIVSATAPVLAQQKNQNFFAGAPATGQLTLLTTVTLSQHTSGAQSSQMVERSMVAEPAELHATARFAPASLRYRQAFVHSRVSLASSLQVASSQSLTVSSTTSAFGFLGLTHYDQRNANGGNQFSVEPPSQGLAVGNGYVVEGVNNAIQVYDLSGQPLLPAVLSTNQVFGVTPSINRVTSAQGVYPTDIRVFYDNTLNRFLIMQRSQDNDIFGNPLPSSRIYIAVSQTGDPTGTYNVYSMDTTNPLHFGCPCISDYPEIGADQYGIYITWNEYNSSLEFLDAVVFAVSKTSLATNASTPTAFQFLIPFTTGYEFAIQPASTPPGGGYFVNKGGLEYFVSSLKSSSVDSNLALWSLTNTSSLSTSNPGLSLLETIVPTEVVTSSALANQRPGPTPLGTSMGARLEFLDGGDSRVQSVVYVGGLLYVTQETLILDDNGHNVIGGAYTILSTVSRGVLTARVQRQGYYYVNNNHLLRPAIAVNTQGQGAVVFTLVGPDYYPSAAFLSISATSTGSTVQIAGAGGLPEDGFSGYSNFGVARWGDYSAAVAASDGSIWMATEFIPNANVPRTTLANWGTYVIMFTP